MKESLEIDTLRLSQCLNHAVFLYDIAGEKKAALRMLKKEINIALKDFK